MGPFSNRKFNVLISGMTYSTSWSVPWVHSQTDLLSLCYQCVDCEAIFNARLPCYWLKHPLKGNWWFINWLMEPVLFLYSVVVCACSVMHSNTHQLLSVSSSNPVQSPKVMISVHIESKSLWVAGLNTNKKWPLIFGCQNILNCLLLYGCIAGCALLTEGVPPSRQ